MRQKEKVTILPLEGKSYSQIVAETGASKSTIHYHAKRLGNPNRKDYSPQILQARDLISKGIDNPKIVVVTGLSVATICKLRRELCIPSTKLWSDRDWLTVQAYYDLGHSLTECYKKFSISAGSVHCAVSRGAFKTRPVAQALPYETILVENSSYNRGDLKRRLIADNLIPNQCAICSAPPEWNGEPLVLILDHINGVNNDNRIENLRLLCPNCNSQTPTFAGRNIKRKAISCENLSA